MAGWNEGRTAEGPVSSLAQSLSRAFSFLLFPRHRLCGPDPEEHNSRNFLDGTGTAETERLQH